MKSKLLIYLSFVMAFCLSSCKKNVAPTELSGSEYIPLSVGNYHIYDIIHIDLNPNTTDTIHYQLKEEISEKDIDLEGNEFFKIKRYKRNTSSDNWSLDSIWRCQINGPNFIRTENNVNYIKLNFPVVKGRSWDGNAYNVFDAVCSEFYYDGFIDYSSSTLDFTDAAQVIICADTLDPLVDNHQEVEYFAKEVGLIYCYASHFDYCQLPADTTAPPCLGLGIIDNGYIEEQSLIEYHLE